MINLKDFRIVVMEKITIELAKNDIFDEKVSAIVSSADSGLNYGKTAAIFRHGGPGLIKETEDYIKSHGRITPGKCITTRSGQLPSC